MVGNMEESYGKTIEGKQMGKLEEDCEDIENEKRVETKSKYQGF
jgi:hypothetical protein